MVEAARIRKSYSRGKKVLKEISFYARPGECVGIVGENGCGKAFMLGLSGHERETAGKLSGGMKKRLSIACSLAGHGRILIMDEPGAALDLLCKEEIRRYLEAYWKGGGIVILTSHDLMELQMCSRIYIMKDGRLTELEKDFPLEQLAGRL